MGPLRSEPEARGPSARSVRIGFSSPILADAPLSSILEQEHMTMRGQRPPLQWVGRIKWDRILVTSESIVNRIRAQGGGGGQAADGLPGPVPPV